MQHQKAYSKTEIKEYETIKCPGRLDKMRDRSKRMDVESRKRATQGCYTLTAKQRRDLTWQQTFRLAVTDTAESTRMIKSSRHAIKSTEQFKMVTMYPLTAKQRRGRDVSSVRSGR